MKSSSVRIIFAEIIGTFIIVFIGTGAMVLDDDMNGALTHGGVCFLWGFAVFLAVYLVEKIGNGHFNPAVTLAFAVLHKEHRSHIILRFIMQCIGALGASLVLRAIEPIHPTLGATLPTIELWEVFLIEVVISFGLMATVLFVIAKNFSPLKSALVIGMYVFIAAYITGPYTGASMNPARSFGPAVITGDLQWMWLYILAPVFGMIVAVSLFSKYRIFRAEIPRG